MSTDLNASFNEQYMSINTKLKKRFMRKPNISEATNEFNALAIQCENSEQPTFAGHAYIGAAKCESSAGNFLAEAEYYLAAARQFIKAEMKLSSLKCFSPDRENLEAAIGCYIQTLNKYQEKSTLRTAIFMELADNLAILNHKLEAISYYEQAVESIEETNAVKLKCLCNLLSLNIQAGRHDVAISTANEICNLTISIPENIISDVQITSVLLTLIVEPIESQKTASQKKLIEDIMSDKIQDLPFSVDLMLKLQSIIISCSLKDVESLIEVSADTSKFFTLQQQDLLVFLIRHMEKRV